VNRIETLDRYSQVVGHDSVKARKLIQQQPYRKDFYLLQCIAQTYLDESRLEDDGGSTMRAFVNWQKWRMAEKYIIESFKLNPDSADVLYTMGEIRKLNGQKDIAIYCFEKIISLGVNRITKAEFSGARIHAKELVNDSKFELYRLYYVENGRLAHRFLAHYKKGLKKGIPTIFKPLRKFLMPSTLTFLK
jgi:tetratricopeptide (TPR) repeat protein